MGKMEEAEPKEEVLEVAAEEAWKPKTRVGQLVLEGKIKSIDEILEKGLRIKEPEVVDRLLPQLKSELALIGSRSGKGGGRQRIPVRITTKMTASGRRFHYSALAMVGDEEGHVGIGRGRSIEPRKAVEKAVAKAKLNLIKVPRGCGSWECRCELPHSIPFKTSGKSGSVRIELYPSPRGAGLVASEEAKKLLRLAGIRDVWSKSFGNTSMVINVVSACFDALKKLWLHSG